MKDITSEEIAMKVMGKEGNCLITVVQNDGVLGAHKSVNVPKTHINLPPLTEKDKRELKPIERIKLVMTRGKDDPKELWDMLGTSDDRKELDRQFKNANGEKEVDFINIVAWRKTAEIIANYTSKGSQIGITGRIQTRSYEGNDGKRVYVTEVVAESVALLDSKQNNQQPQQKQETPFNNNNQMDIDNLTLPF